MEQLPHPDNLHLEAALGWLMLGDPASAKEELAKLTPASREKPDVLEVEWSLHAATNSWASAYEAAERLVRQAPSRSYGWIHRAYAARRMPGGGLAQAWDALRPAAEKFPKVFLIPYNLACYAAQMGRLEEAWQWLQRAAEISDTPEKVVNMALADSDLKPLWPKLMGETP
jgi:predicted Zn-dependent protease